jgi:hypothetical protein
MLIFLLIIIKQSSCVPACNATNKFIDYHSDICMFCKETCSDCDLFRDNC